MNGDTLNGLIAFFGVAARGLKAGKMPALQGLCGREFSQVGDGCDQFVRLDWLGDEHIESG